MKQSTYTTFEISQFCDVSMLAVIKWIEQNKLVAHRTPGGHRRVKHEDLMDFLRHYQMPIPKSLEPTQKVRVLIVDDDELILKFIKKILKRSSPEIEIETAQDGFEAGRKATEFAPDLVFLDLHLPGVDGFKVCRDIKSRKNNSTKVVIITAKNINENRRESVRNGADEFLAKPFDEKQILSSVNKLLGRTVNHGK